GRERLGEPGAHPMMGYLKEQWRVWRQDRLLGAVVRNTSYLFSGSTASMALTMFQGVLAAWLLGPAGYGALGMIVLFTSSINRLFSFRMGELVVTYAGQQLALGHRQQAAAVIKAAGLSEALTSVAAYLILVLLAPLAAVHVLKDELLAPLIVYYGIALLGNLMTETATAVLQVGSHYRSQAALTLAQSVLTASWGGVVFLTGGGVFELLTAYLAGKLLFGLGIMALAFHWLHPVLGAGWWRAPLSLISNRREMLRFAVSTNLSGTINMVIRDSEVLWVGFFLSSLEAGYYKFALAMMNIILMPVAPFITTTFPEISRSVAKKDWKLLRLLLRRTSLVAAVWTAACAVGLLLFGEWILGWFRQGTYLPAYPIILILLIGFGCANILFWNRPLLLAFGRPNFPLKVTALLGAAKTGLMFVLVPVFGYLAQAGLLSGYFVISVLLIVWRGWKCVRQAEADAPQEASG
ncbi:MAG: oligosaccharide flippase family protein, partial [Anaerolineaceae bacterium]|nr:oligosaccharide flippase family protein [Anaerolineaceae bacterium]